MKEVFWGDYKIDKKEVIKLIKNGNNFDKNFLFEKILYNSSNILKDLNYFTKKDLTELLKNYKIKNSYKKNFILKRLKILKYLYLGQKQDIKELKWKD